jgi:hypothetical protein
MTAGFPAAVLSLVLAAASLAGTDDKHAAAAASPPFESFKALAGEWVAAEDNELVKKGDLVARYEVTAGGSAVVETIFPGRPHEMRTVYTVDGADLVLTHYCVNGNQPQMRARGAKGARVDFAFDGGHGIDAKTTKHMNSASFDFVGHDELRSEWREIKDGKPVFTAKMHIVRQAR